MLPELLLVALTLVLHELAVVASSDTTESTSSCFLQFQKYDPELDLPFVYLLMFIGIILLCSIVYWLNLMKKQIIYAKNCQLKLLSYVRSVKSFWRMYVSIFTQLFDQVSDISVIYQLYWLSQDEIDENKNDLCPLMNISHLFRLSLAVFLFHRFLSSLLVLRYSRYHYGLALLQLLDLSFIQTLQINYKFQNAMPCSPQRYLTNLEAMFESYPQFIVQYYFIITLYITEPDTVNIFENWVVVISICLSFVSMINKKLSQDRDLVKPEWKDLSLNGKALLAKFCCCVYKPVNQETTTTEQNIITMVNMKTVKSDTADIPNPKNEYESESDTGTETDDDSNNKPKLDELKEIEIIDRQMSDVVTYETVKDNALFNKYALCRIVWRFFNLGSRLCMWFLIWRVIGGPMFVGLLLFELSYYGAISFLTQNLVFIENIMGYVCETVVIKCQHSEEIDNYLNNSDANESLLSFCQSLTSVLFVIFLSIMFTIPLITDCCQAISEDLAPFSVVWFVFVGVGFCLLPCLLCVKTRMIINSMMFVILFFRVFCLFLIFVFFYDYNIFLILLGYDVIIMFAVSFFNSSHCFSRKTFEFFCATYIVAFNSPAVSLAQFIAKNGDFKVTDCLLYSFQLTWQLVYFVFVVFVLVNESIDVGIWTDYNQIVQIRESSIMIGLLIFVGVNALIVFPISVYLLIFSAKMVNKEATNDRSLETLAASGDIYALVEMSKFGRKVPDADMRQYLKQACVTNNFRRNIFSKYSFLQQYQIVTYLWQHYNVQLPLSYQNEFIANLNINQCQFRIGSKDKIEDLTLFLECLYVGFWKNFYHKVVERVNKKKRKKNKNKKKKFESWDVFVDSLIQSEIDSIDLNDSYQVSKMICSLIHFSDKNSEVIYKSLTSLLDTILNKKDKKVVNTNKKENDNNYLFDYFKTFRQFDVITYGMCISHCPKNVIAKLYEVANLYDANLLEFFIVYGIGSRRLPYLIKYPTSIVVNNSIVFMGDKDVDGTNEEKITIYHNRLNRYETMSEECGYESINVVPRDHCIFLHGKSIISFDANHVASFDYETKRMIKLNVTGNQEEARAIQHLGMACLATENYLIVCKEQKVTTFKMDFSDIMNRNLHLEKKHELRVVDAVFENPGMAFVPNSNEKEILLFGSFNSNFKDTLRWLSVVNDYESIEINKEKTEQFSKFVDDEIGDTQYHEFGYTLCSTLSSKYLILFGGDTYEDSEHYDTDEIFYFDFDSCQWHQSQCKLPIRAKRMSVEYVDGIVHVFHQKFHHRLSLKEIVSS